MLMMAVVIKWTKLDSCMPRGSKDYEANQLLCGKGIPREDEGFEREVLIRPYIADYNFIS